MHYEPSYKQDLDLIKSFSKELFKGGVESKYSNHALEAINAPLITPSKIIYSPTFMTSDKKLSFTGDVLALSGKINWLVQFHCSLMILLPEHIFDIGFQYKVISELLYSKMITQRSRKLHFKIAYLNKKYNREKLIDIDQLFVMENVSYRAHDNQVLINREITKIEKILDKDVIPTAKVGKHCVKPFKCDFFEYCWTKVPKGSIHNVSGLTSKQIRFLEDNEINTIQEIPDDFRLSHRTLTELKAVFKNQAIIKRAKIQKYFNTIDSTDSISFLNLETIQTAIPMYENCRPNEILPYQYCLMFRSNSFSDFKKSIFLADSAVDPRLQFIENLISDIRSKGPIVVYNYTKTISILFDVSNVYPEFKDEIAAIISRLWDLGAPVNNGWYFHHSMTKNKDLKTVLSALDNNKLYANLKIKNSDTAASYYRLITAYPIRRGGQMVRAINEFSHAEATASFEVFEIFNSM